MYREFLIFIFSKYEFIKTISETYSDVKSESDELQELFKSGRITFYEYEKRLNKLINRNEQITHFLNEEEHYLNTLPLDTVMNEQELVKGVLNRIEEKRKRRKELRQAKMKDDAE